MVMGLEVSRLARNSVRSIGVGFGETGPERDHLRGFAGFGDDGPGGVEDAGEIELTLAFVPRIGVVGLAVGEEARATSTIPTEDILTTEARFSRSKGGLVVQC
jgi:hypothetical protein